MFFSDFTLFDSMTRHHTNMNKHEYACSAFGYKGVNI